MDLPPNTRAMDAPTSPAAAVADGVRRNLDSRHVTTERIASGILVAILGVGLLAGLAVAWIAGWPALAERLAASGGALAVIAGLGWLAYSYPAIDHRRRSYTVRPAGIEIRKGVLWRSVVNVARSRVQHTDVVQGPLLRRFDLATLVIHTAGTENASIELPGLAYETALAMRDFLVREDETSSDGEDEDERAPGAHPQRTPGIAPGPEP
ncbi:MAG: PH domain-containing protein [Planctomycetota bacterium]